ncbi:SDR family oxidoreductase [Hoeflea sp. G2-23]|uniref:SDR family oxidoreductase n=1 Tax=Hoeflea algicola TaxID=2983763 RepID=A0ABT3Z3S9_9HYPH|nr:SDR family oxidoreductase [Hoeflea algicola]MCY0146426.1 SDR family oxidoreductase [Hoeflea algicola]
MTSFTPTALITGAGRRIGKAIALDLAAHGFQVAVHANSGRAEAVVDTIRSNGGVAEVFVADLSDGSAVRQLHADVSARMDSPDLIVNNASVFEDDDIRALDDAVFDLHFAIHLKAPLILAEAMAGSLQKDREGLIVNIIDQRVWRLAPRRFYYTLSKSALWSATQLLAQNLAPHIRVNAIDSGPTLANERQSENDFADQTRAVPLGHDSDLTEFGATIRYLHQARSITGQVIALDGVQHLAGQTPVVANIAE